MSITAVACGHQHLRAQAVTREEPPSAAARNGQQHSQPEPPDLSAIPLAAPFPPETPPEKAVIESDLPQTRHGDIFSASGNVVVTYRDRILRADEVTYDQGTGDVTLLGHVHVSGGENDESLQASHAVFNLHSQTGTFYDVTGSVGLSSTARNGYVTPNPFLFSGRKVVKTGPQNYEIYDGSVTSCMLPHPDWLLQSKRFTLDSRQARASNSTFKLLGIPVLFLPYVTHPVDATERQSGLLIPTLGYSTASANTGSKGLTIGEQAYLTLGRSADLTVGTIYYSLRGFSENGTVRYRGVGDDFFNAHFSALQDRGFNATVDIPDAAGAPIPTVIYTNQGGEDVTAGFRRQFTPSVRAVGDGEYLSTYIFREAFTESFNQAVSSDILSTLFLTRQKNGYSLDGRVDRYQGEKVAPTYLTTGEEVKIFHAPSIDFTALDHIIPGTPLLWSLESSAAGLKRVQPNFTSSGITERLDVHPELSLPLSFGGMQVLTSVALRDTFYSRSRQIPYSTNKNDPYPPNAAPIEINDPANRESVELNIDIRPPVLERTFEVPQNLQWMLGREVRHTIEPEIVYRNVHGISNFLSLLRFDDTDLASDTDELEYGLTQHLYFRPRPRRPTRFKPRPGCPTLPQEQRPAAAPVSPFEADNLDLLGAVNDAVQRASNDANGIPNISATAPDIPTRTRRHVDPCAPPPAATPQQEWFSWKLAQKTFFAQNFGGAVVNNRRNIFDTTLALSGIAFLTEARNISPLVSRMRFRTGSHSDVEWDFDYDTGATKFTSQNVFFDFHEHNVFGGVSYAYLDAPGRFRTATINSSINLVTGLVTSPTSNFSQLRLLIGYGSPTRPGIAAAGGAGIDLNLGEAQYVTLQSSYNWNCCGLSVEYRKYDLGTVRNEGAYRFNFTLANIGTAGNLRRAEALF
jgi:LPS-assembly protein